MRQLSNDELVQALDRRDWSVLWVQGLPLVSTILKVAARRGAIPADRLDEDAIQQARLYVGEMARRWRPLESPFATWIVTACVYAMQDWFRVQANRGIGSKASSPEHVELDAPEPEFAPIDRLEYADPPEGYGNPADEAIRQQAQEALRDAVTCLPSPAERITLTSVCGLEGHPEVSPEDYARSAGESVRTTYRRLGMARERLRRRLEGWR